MTDDLTKEAQKILQAAVDGDGSIMLLRTFGGVTIQAGGKSMIPDDADNRTVQFWIGGLEDLQTVGYVRDVGQEGELFEVTREGYKTGDRLFE